MSATAAETELLSQRLGERRAELEEEMLNRVRAIQDCSSPAQQVFDQELPATVGAVLDYGLDLIKARSTERPPQVPDQLLLDARRAARSHIDLAIVLRRHCCINTLLMDTLVEEASYCRFSWDGLRCYFRSLSIGVERLASAVGEEYARAAGELVESIEERRREMIDLLLAGELVEGSELAYDFTGWHLGVVASGVDVHQVIRSLSVEAGANLLSIDRRDGVVWAWLGSRSRETLARLPETLPDGRTETAVALGEPGHRLRGWRLTHRQAAATLPLAIKGTEKLVRYSDAPLLVAALNENLLAASLRQIYLSPLAEERDGGAVARSTLRVYFQASRNASSAAAALGVDRRTIASRLNTIEERLGRRLDLASAEIETALRLEAFEEQARLTSTSPSSASAE